MSFLLHYKQSLFWNDLKGDVLKAVTYNMVFEMF